MVDEPEPDAAPVEKKRKRRFGAARLTGLMLIAVLAIGLAYVKASSGGDTMSVPAGAKAGQLTLHPCHYGTEQGSRAADCGTLVVPENRAKPGSRLIALPVTRINARSAHPGAPVFRLEGGPGISNMHFSKASRIAENHDGVLVGYRGVDGSEKLDCPEVASALKRSTDLLGQKSFDAYTDGFRSCASRLQAEGVDLAGYSIPAQVDDLETARKALGYGKIDLISESAGTRVAMIYAWRYPKSIHRSVMIGVNPPGHYLWDPKTADSQIKRYSRLCAQDPKCSDRTDDLAASMKKTAADMPDRFWGLPFDENATRITSFYGLMESTSWAEPLSAPMTLSAWLSAAKGDPSGFWFMSLVARMAFPESFTWGELAAIARTDTLAAKRYFAKGPHRSDSILRNAATEFLFAGGGLIDAWPATPDENEYARVRRSNVPTLLIGSMIDFTTPPENGIRELLPHLSNGRHVIFAELGHTTSFWTYEPDAQKRLLNTYLDTGRVDTSLYTPPKVDFTPDVTHTALGKGFAATMVGLPLFVLLSLLLMWRRSRRRGRFGRTASVLLRSAFTLVLGLGGWFAGVVVALVAFPTVALDDALLAVVSIGVPIGLGVHLAWVDRSRGRAFGLTGSLVGALAGAFVGFHAGTGLLAVVTTIVGAAIGSNLVLLLLDIARGSASPRVAQPAPALAPAEV